jgi:hypothetical protein
MAANVRCTGLVYDVPHHPDRWRLSACATDPGTRWEGYRMVVWNPRDGRHLLQPRLPCPRCGGKVELIQDGPDGSD